MAIEGQKLTVQQADALPTLDRMRTDVAYLNGEKVDLTSGDFIPKHVPRGVTVRADGEVTLVLAGEVDDGDKITLYLTRGRVHPFAAIKVYQTGTDVALRAAGMIVLVR